MKRLYDCSKLYLSVLRPSLLIVLLVSSLSLSCGKNINPKAIVGGRLHMDVTVSEEANRNNPVAVDLVLVYDQKLLEKIAKYPARTWFERRDQIRRDYILEEALEVWQWEWVPGQKVTVTPIPLKVRFAGGYIFAGYRSPGEHRFPIDPKRNLSLELKEKGFVVRDGSRPERP